MAITATRRNARPSALAALAATWLLTATATAQVAGEPVYWSSHDLTIPYRLNAIGAQQAGEVVLYYSADRGRSWLKAGSALPMVRSFRFRAPGDGEFWFAIRTYDAAGRATPPQPLSAEMRVVVDSALPVIQDLKATLDDRGLFVGLTASDTGGVAADAVHVYAQANGHGGWLPIPLEAAPYSGLGPSVSFTGKWVPPTGTQHVALRAAVADRAGNRAERETLATLGAAPGGFVAAPPTARTPAFGPALGAAPPRRPAGSAVDPFAAAEGRASFASQSLAPRRERERLTFDDPAAATTPWPTDRAPTRPLQTPPPPSRESSASPFGMASFGAPSAREEFERASALPPSRLVNSPEFEFDYELDQSGRWGVAKVELWGTDDNGRSWRRFAIDSDRQSPIHVRTPGEGTYGFRLVVESIGGLAPVTPRPGDEPEATVGVDLRLPRVVVTSARQGDGYFADQLIIDWDADDEHLAGRPVDLYYGTRPTGPWVPIATNLPNNGRHSWRLQRHLPRRMHIRVEARDEAGNIGAAVTPQAIEVDVPRASGTLKAVRAAG